MTDCGNSIGHLNLEFPEMSVIEPSPNPKSKFQMSIADILVVDDDIAVCRIVHRMLSDMEYDIQTVHSIADALGAVEQKSFDVYLLDYKLPNGSGLDVAERIRSKWGATPIILISGYDPSAVALRAEKLGISEFLEKPFSREIICAAVKKALNSTKPAAELPLAAPAPVSGPTRPRFWQRRAKRPAS
jgi:DNA-binding NtrC family response regulator